MTVSKKLSSFANDLANKYTALFDVYRDEKLDQFSLAFFAIYHRRDERYMLSKKIKVYGVENQQIVFTLICDGLTLNDIHEFQETIEKNITKYIPEKDEHMSTVVLGIVITDQNVDKKVIKEVKSYRKLKFIKFGLHGWVDMYSVLINLKDRTIYVHPKGKSFVESIEKMTKEEVNV